MAPPCAYRQERRAAKERRLQKQVAAEARMRIFRPRNRDLPESIRNLPDKMKKVVLRETDDALQTYGITSKETPAAERATIDALSMSMKYHAARNAYTTRARPFDTGDFDYTDLDTVQGTTARRFRTLATREPRAAPTAARTTGAAARTRPQESARRRRVPSNAAQPAREPLAEAPRETRRETPNNTTQTTRRGRRGGAGRRTSRAPTPATATAPVPAPDPGTTNNTALRRGGRARRQTSIGAEFAAEQARERQRRRPATQNAQERVREREQTPRRVPGRGNTRRRGTPEVDTQEPQEPQEGVGVRRGGRTRKPNPRFQQYHLVGAGSVGKNVHANVDVDIQRSSRKFKKYVASVRRGSKGGKVETVHFGDKRYEHYKDATGLGLYSHLDHSDEARRKRYLSRHGRRVKKYSAKYFSHKYLWDYPRQNNNVGK